MQKSNVDFYPVLLLSILADTLLRLHTGYWARAGLLALPASAAVLAAVLLSVSTSWQGNALLQKVLCTTEEFLRNFGVDSTDNLPEISPVKMEDFRAEVEEEMQIKLDV